MKKEPDKDFYKCIKVPLKHIAKHDDTIDKINNVVIKANKIIIHALQFIKLYSLKYYEDNNKIPNIDEIFINCVLKTMCNEQPQGRPPKQEIADVRKILKKFYDEHFKQLNVDTNLDYLNMNTILDYITTDIKTMFDNNIKQHYIEYIERFINVVWKKKFMIEKIRKLKITKKERKFRISQLCSELRKIKTDVLNVIDTDYKSKWFYHDWINEVKKIVIPTKTKFDKENIYYDLQCHPDDYFICMFNMMKYVESEDETIYNLFPMRTEIIPKHIKIDTTSIVHCLMEKNKAYFTTKGRLKTNEDKIWKFFFRTELSCFTKKNYTFNHMINTDGLSCSILLIRNDMIGKQLPKHKIKQSFEKYIDELDDTKYEQLKDKKIIACDPNKSDLIYCIDSLNRDRNQYRYTQNQIRKETKQKKYRNIMNKKKQNEEIKGKNIIEIETELSDRNHKTLDMYKFEEYLNEKNRTNQLLFKFYEDKLFRKLRLNSYINKIQNEQNMIKNFIDIFGEQKDVVVCIGDWCQKKQMKYKEPTKGLGIRRTLRKNGFDVYLVDEDYTSCKCSKCHGDCETFRTCENPRPWKKDEIILRHGLLMCKTCKRLWNRDENSSRNIHKIAWCAIHKKQRPEYLCREKKQVISGTTSVSHNQNLCKSVKTKH